MSNPLQDSPPAEVRLDFAPLARVISVVQFSPVMKIVDPSGAGIADFQERIRKRYPSLLQEQQGAFQFQVDEHGNAAPPLLVSQPVWRFLDKGKSWRVSLTRESIGLETQSAYRDRAEFLDRLRELCAAIEDVYAPSQYVRLGIRYVNVLGGERLQELANFVRPEFLSFGHAPFSEHVLSSNQLADSSVPEGRMLVRFGILPAGHVHDPNALDPVDERRYFLDLDAFVADPLDFSNDEIQTQAKALTERIYTMFRWAVTPALLESCNA